MTTEEITELANAIAEKLIFCKKEVLNSKEAAQYLSMKRSYLYKLTMNRQIPYYKPRGKMCYFNRQELDHWIQSSRVATDDELMHEAEVYCMNNRGRKSKSSFR